jgi:UDP-glucose 4-epimerase
MEFLVTGGAGFIGSHLVERLVRDGRQVRVVDNFMTGNRDHLRTFADKIELVEADLADPAVCERACRGVRVVFHQAALPSVPKSVDDPVRSHRSNLEATLNLLVAARAARVSRFVYAASSSAYGESPELPKVESMPACPLSPYAVQKLASEHYCTVFARCYGLQTISLRYFNVFGPRQDPASQYAAAVPAFITAILGDTPPTVYGDGLQTRDFTYIDNVVQANLLAASAPTTIGEVLNIACGERITINDLINQINGIVGKRVTPRHVPERPGDIKHSWADIDLAARLIGYRPTVTLADGLRRTIDWYKERIARSV